MIHFLDIIDIMVHSVVILGLIRHAAWFKGEIRVGCRAEESEAQFGLKANRLDGWQALCVDADIMARSTKTLAFKSHSFGSQLKSQVVH